MRKENEHVLEAFGFISHIYLVKSPQKEFVRERWNLEGDWTTLQLDQLDLLLLDLPVRGYLLVLEASLEVAAVHHSV